ncbi:uncharacterized protein BO95DRAFT_461918 [Aspergillus brunneoviolaceus CBS 621.78]|uniref:Uncharacterized protein n=1 Tax=Aspergillus brunneoviolaceus CBS 621.78 TaxID=1450534 RepID=A0ACD1GED5_9EURO|nr:hypothetical protein BO95DRAFT_461918 [Aspergillus brunneoviolaceus CBS 621.78]RAH47538.1 hypothetical protein BO95DRAFT_461918 [Aspergillus brunneoviolaceus CBS 621.78]
MEIRIQVKRPPDRLAQVPIEYSTRFREAITCRVWLKEALFALDDEGYIKLMKDIGSIEDEAKGQAVRNRVARKVTVTKSAGSIS